MTKEKLILDIMASTARIAEPEVSNIQVYIVDVPARQIGPFVSEVLTLGMPDPDGAVVLVRPDLKVPNGGKLF